MVLVAMASSDSKRGGAANVCDGRSERRLAVHLGEEARDRVGADRHADGGEQFANEPERRALLPQLDDAIFERHQLCVTRR